MLDSLLSGRILRVQQLLEATVYHPKRPIIIPNVRLSSHTSSIIIPNVRLSSHTSSIILPNVRLSSQTYGYHSIRPIIIPKRPIVIPNVPFIIPKRPIIIPNVPLSSPNVRLSLPNVRMTGNMCHLHRWARYPL